MSIAFRTQTVTIAASGTESSVALTEGQRLIGIIMPAALDGTLISVYGGVSSDAMAAMYEDTGAPVQVVPVAGKYILTTWAMIRAPYLQLVSNSTESAARTFTLVLEEVC